LHSIHISARQFPSVGGAHCQQIVQHCQLRLAILRRVNVEIVNDITKLCFPFVNNRGHVRQRVWDLEDWRVIVCIFNFDNNSRVGGPKR
jgi:hypothetical protein